ncbi:HdeD family acid-resistance protein [Sciscionella sediminilitoris]|uniref:HdeD family acid-resistance protein n=1 Tax=Sciscionella sediminilitoris TaxID=1445613 RepID=UPI000562CFAB|nr:HdeD family acid-resistance protein [Sciscionella sp. SE31]
MSQENAAGPEDPPLAERAREVFAELTKRTWQAALGIGICTLAIGIVVLLWPAPTLVVVAVLFGIYLLVSGILQLIAAFGSRAQHGWSPFLGFLSGALSIVLAVIAFRNLGSSLVILAIGIGIGWLVRGITGLSLTSAFPRGTPGRGWGLVLFTLTCAAGVMLIVWPLSSIPTLLLASGIALVALGIVEVTHALRIRSALRAAESR